MGNGSRRTISEAGGFGIPSMSWGVAGDGTSPFGWKLLIQVMGEPGARFRHLPLRHADSIRKRIANGPRGTSHQDASPDGIEVNLKVHVSAPFGICRHSPSGRSGSS